jgi:hypothetical protein
MRVLARDVGDPNIGAVERRLAIRMRGTQAAVLMINLADDYDKRAVTLTAKSYVPLNSERFCSVSTGQISVCGESSTISIRRSVTERSGMLPPENQGAACVRTQPRHLRHSGHLLYAGLPTLHDANENSGRDTCRCEF